MTWMQPAIRERRALLTARLSTRLSRIAKALEKHIHIPDKLDALLEEALPSLSPSTLIYVVNRQGKQLS